MSTSSLYNGREYRSRSRGFLDISECGPLNGHPAVAVGRH